MKNHINNDDNSALKLIYKSETKWQEKQQQQQQYLWMSNRKFYWASQVAQW